MSTRRAGEGLRASSHFSDNSIESSVRGLTLGGGSGLYRVSALRAEWKSAPSLAAPSHHTTSHTHAQLSMSLMDPLQGPAPP